MIICICRKVSDKTIVDAIRNGNETLEDLKECLGVCVQCRKCEKSINQLIEDGKEQRSSTDNG